MRAPETFETERLHLRPVKLSDAAAIFQYAGAIAPTYFMPFQRHRDIANSLAFAKRCEECWTSGSAFPWAIVERMSGDFLGVLELRLAPPKADFGYILAEACWGKGFATEAASAVASWAIAQPPIWRVWATCHPTTQRRLRSFAKRVFATKRHWQIGKHALNSTKPLGRATATL